MRRWPIFVAVLYCLGGIGAWVHFAVADASGLGNLGLMMYVLPVSMLGFAIGKVTGSAEFVLIPKGLSYLSAHALFFFPSLLLLTYLVGWRFPAMYRRMMED
jgi:hypothetical protein